MSFATGLFSFMGGMSQQYREEVDAKRASDAAAAAAAAEHVKWQAEQDFEKEKFETDDFFKKLTRESEVNWYICNLGTNSYCITYGLLP